MFEQSIYRVVCFKLKSTKYDFKLCAVQFAVFPKKFMHKITGHNDLTALSVTVCKALQ